MKISLLVCTVAASLCVVTAAEAQQAVSKTSQRNSRASATISRTNSPTFSRQQRTQQTRFAVTPTRTDGVIARTARAGDKFQMINPAAPDEYGDGRDVTRHEVDDPYQRAQGIKLVTVEF